MTQYAFYLNMDNCIGCKVLRHGLHGKERSASRNPLSPHSAERNGLLGKGRIGRVCPQRRVRILPFDGLQPLCTSCVCRGVPDGSHDEGRGDRHRFLRSRDMHRVRGLRRGLPLWRALRRSGEQRRAQVRFLPGIRGCRRGAALRRCLLDERARLWGHRRACRSEVPRCGGDDRPSAFCGRDGSFASVDASGEIPGGACGHGTSNLPEELEACGR